MPHDFNCSYFRLRDYLTRCCLSVMTADTTLEDVDSSKYLGTHLDWWLTWNLHIDTVCTKLSYSIYVLRSLSKHWPTQVLRMAYYGVTYPHLSYGLILRGECARSKLQRVYGLLKQAIRLLAKIDRREYCRKCFLSIKIFNVSSIFWKRHFLSV